MSKYDPSHGISVVPQAMFHQITPDMVRARTGESEINAGSKLIERNQRDYEQEKREVTGETDPDRQHSVLYPWHRAHE
jgi:hypothetical protein